MKMDMIMVRITMKPHLEGHLELDKFPSKNSSEVQPRKNLDGRWSSRLNCLTFMEASSWMSSWIGFTQLRGYSTAMKYQIQGKWSWWQWDLRDVLLPGGSRCKFNVAEEEKERSRPGPRWIKNYKSVICSSTSPKACTKVCTTWGKQVQLRSMLNLFNN